MTEEFAKREAERYISRAIIMDVPIPVDVVFYREGRPVSVCRAGLYEQTEYMVELSGGHHIEFWHINFKFCTFVARQFARGDIVTYDVERFRAGMLIWAQRIMAAPDRPSANPGSSEPTGSRGWIARLFRLGQAA